jgi:nucleotide-binding universal stress UspA family protein
MLNLSKKILVAIDGSPQSDKAAEEAVRLARASGIRFVSKIYAILALPGVRTPSFTDFSPSLPVTERPDWEDKRKRIFYVVEKAAAEAEIPLHVEVVYGDAAEEILAFAEQEAIDVIVIGSSGTGRVKRAFLGSVSSKVSLRARCSVYIVR